jgi:hypothetical protein
MKVSQKHFEQHGAGFPHVVRAGLAEDARGDNDLAAPLSLEMHA